MLMNPKRAAQFRSPTEGRARRSRAWGERLSDRTRGKVDDAADWSVCVTAIARYRDKARFAELFGFFAPRLKSFFIRLGVAPSGAEDLAQDVMLMVWRKAEYFDPELASASTWIFTIARNLRIDLKRRERDPRLLDELTAPPPEAGPGEHTAWRQREERVRAALGQLPGDQADVIRLSFFEDRPHSEIAQALDIPLGTVKSRVRLAMNRLRALVGELA